MENRRYYHLLLKTISSALGAVALSFVLIRYHGSWRELGIDIDSLPFLVMIYAVFQIIAWAVGAFCSSAEFLEELMKRRDARPFYLEENADVATPETPEVPGLQLPFWGALFCAIGVFAISLFVTLPLLAYLDDWLWIAGTGVSESASFLVFSISLFSTGWVISLLARLAKGGVTRRVIRNYMATFFAVNGAAVLSLVLVIAVWRRYGFSIESSSWTGVVALIGVPLLFYGMSSLLSWADRRNAWSLRESDR